MKPTYLVLAVPVLLLAVACGDDDERDNPPPPPPDVCTPDLATDTSGGATQVREVEITFTATGCADIDAAVRRGDRYVPATHLGGGDYRAWVDLESGANVFEVVARVDGEEHVGPSVSFEYSATAPTATAASGFVVGEVLDAADNSPIEGATVYLRDVPGEVETDANGEYQYPTPAPGRYLLTAEAAGYTFAQRPFAVSTGTRRRVATVYLVALDPLTARITPEAGGTLVNSAGDVELVVPAGAVRNAVDVSAVSFPRHEALPAPLPDSSRWTQALNLSPDGVRFDEPATLRVENVLGFPAGTEIPVGYYNRELAAWEPEAMGVVSGDGLWIDMTVTHFSAYDHNLPTEEEPPPGSGMKKPDPCKEGSSGASLVNDTTGALKLFVPVSQAVRGDRRCAARLTYDSAHATGVTPFVFPISLSELDDLEEISAQLVLEGRAYTASLTVGGTPADTYFVGQQLVPFNQWGGPIASGLYALQMRVTASATVNYMTAEVFGGPGVEDTGVASREPVPFDNRRIVPLVFVDDRDSPLGAGWRFEEEERLYTHSSGDLVAWERPRGTSVIYMGYPDSLVLDAAPYAVANELVDFFILDDDRVVLVTPHAVHLAPDFGSFGLATELANVIETISMAAIGDGGVAIWDDNQELRWVGLDGGTSDPINPTAVMEAEGLVPGFTIAGLWTAMTVDRDNVIYLDLAGFGLARVAGLDTGAPAVDWTRTMGVGEQSPAIVDLDYSPSENAMYLLVPGAGVIQRIDMETGTESTVATTGSLIRGGDGDALTRVFAAPDGSVYVANPYGEVGRITPEGIPSPFASIAFNHDAEHRCQINIVRFEADGEPVFHCRPTNSSWSSKFFAANWQRGRDLRYDHVLTRSGSGATLVGKGQSRTFDTQGRLTERTIQGITEAFVYSGDRLTQYDDGFGGSVQFHYTGDQLSSITDQGGNTTTVTIDGSGDLTQIADSDGHTLTFTYQNHVIQARTADGAEIAYTWNGTGVATATLPTGEVRQYASLLETIGAGNIADDTVTSTFTDGEGYAFTQRYAWHGRPTEIDAAGQIWDIIVLPELPTSGNGPTLTLDAVRDDDTEIVRVAADDEKIFLANVNDVDVWWANYDDQGRPTRVASYGSVCDIGYETQGIDDVSCNDRFYMDFIYTDADVMPDAIDDYNGERWTLTRDAHGNIETITDPLSGVVTVTRNQAGFVTAIQGANTETLGIDRDDAGNPTAFHLPIAGESVAFTWDRVPTCDSCVDGFVDRVSSITDGLSNTWNLAVRADGTIGSVTNPLGQVRNFTYDGRRLLTGINGPGATNLQLTRNAQGDLLTFVIDGATTTFTHGSDNRFLTADGPDIDLSRTYTDSPLQVDETVTHPGGTTYTVTTTANALYASIAGFAISGGEAFGLYGFEGAEQVFATFEPAATAAAWDQFGRSAGGGLSTRWIMDRSENLVVSHDLSHDLVHRIGAMEVTAGATTDTLTYAYDGSMPYLTSATASNGALYPSLTFTHDAAGRLTGVGGDVTASYTYDQAGRLASTDWAGTFTYDDAGRLLSNSVATYTYEPRGTRASRTDLGNNEVWRYTFDSGDRLTAVEKYTDAAAVTPYSTVSLVYDPLWRLARVDVDGLVTHLAWVGPYLVGELDAAGAVVRQYVPMVRPDDPVIMVEGGQDYYFVKDHTGSVHRVVDVTGAVVASYSYDGFGRVLSATGTLASQPRRFAGAYYLEAIGLYYMRARWYDPEIGQFISEDRQMYVAPYVHPYAYAGNDPTRFVDTTGFGPSGGNPGGGGGGIWGPSNGGPPTPGNTIKDMILDPLKGEILGDVGTAVDIVSTLSEYGSDPVKNAETGIKFIFDKTLLSHSPVMRDIANSFLDFAKGARDFFGFGPC